MPDKVAQGDSSVKRDFDSLSFSSSR